MIINHFKKTYNHVFVGSRENIPTQQLPLVVTVASVLILLIASCAVGIWRKSKSFSVI